MKKSKVFIPFKLVKLTKGNNTVSGYHLIIQGKVFTKKVNILIDTGASTTVFDYQTLLPYIDEKDVIKSAVQSKGFTGHGMESYLSAIKKLRLGKEIFENVEVVLLDFESINQTYKEAGVRLKISGIIGSDFLLMHKAVIDLEKQILSLKK